VLIDANVLISYLLNPTGEGPPSMLLRAATAGRVTPIVSPQLLREVSQKVATKPYLADRIPANHVDRLAQALTMVGEVREDADVLFPAITRDRKDDYLVANAVIYGVDFLVSGDHDLLELGEFEGVRIVSPAVFAALLNHSDE
jgi:putative PIN family toxin of toxin-antitoxin system